jgi:hypothetical protein
MKRKTGGRRKESDSLKEENKEENSRKKEGK